MMSYLMVFLGAGIGGAMRHGANIAVTRALGPHFPFGIMLINVIGCLAMGLIAGWFSAFSLDAGVLYERGELGLAALYVLGSVALSLAAVFAGLWAVRQIG